MAAEIFDYKLRALRIAIQKVFTAFANVSVTILIVSIQKRIHREGAEGVE
jgi:hypothetical protein